MSMTVDQILSHVTQSLTNKQAVVAAPGGQAQPLPGVGAAPGAQIAPLGPGGGAMPPEMMGGMPPMPPEMMGGMPPMPPEMMGGMPPEMMGGMPPPGGVPAQEDPIMMLQQDMADMRDLMQQLIDGQTAIIESLVGDTEPKGDASAEAPAPEAAPPPMPPEMMGGMDPAMMGMPPEMMGGMPPTGAMPPPGSDDELLSMMQQGLRS